MASADLERPVAVVGAGLTGASWAGLFCSRGLQVRVHDQSAQALSGAMERARDYARFLTEYGLADPECVERGLASLRPAAEISEALEGVGFVQECVYEDYEVKERVFKAADRYAPRDAVIATSSSGLSISRIQTVTRYPGRCVAGHPYNPPHLIPLVEVAPGDKTSPETVQRARRFYEAVGKAPVVLSREVPGYLANRMSAALWREAINLVLDGVASAEDVDRAVRLGPGLRWAVMGPHLLYHLGGGKEGIRYHIEHLRAAKEGIWRTLKDWKTMPENTTEVLEGQLPGLEKLGDLAEERDRTLAGILRALYASASRASGDSSGGDHGV